MGGQSEAALGLGIHIPGRAAPGGGAPHSPGPSPRAGPGEPIHFRGKAAVPACQNEAHFENNFSNSRG